VDGLFRTRNKLSIRADIDPVTCGRASAIALLATTAVLALGAQSAGADRPYVAARDAMRLNSIGVDRWDVWVCKVPRRSTSGEWRTHARVRLSARRAARPLKRRVAPYFRWLSEGKYRPRFHPRGTIHIGKADGERACTSAAARRSAGRDGAVVVPNVRVHGEHAGAVQCAERELSRAGEEPCRGEPVTLPHSHRIAVLGPQDLLPLVHGRSMISTAAHELGHTISWPHSFTGRLYVGMKARGKRVRAAIDYDDPFDVMGYQRLWGTGRWQKPLTGRFRLKGTQAFNRYAAGWVRPSAVAVDDSPDARYRIDAIGGGGTQLVIVPSQNPMAFLTLEAKARRGYDRVLPRAGVQIHAIDQRGTACQGPLQDSPPAACADGRRQVPIPNRPDSLASTIRTGQSVQVAGLTIRVLRRTASGGFVVRVLGERAELPVIPSSECFLFHYKFNCAAEPKLG
jgi:hypothetical protein